MDGTALTPIELDSDQEGRTKLRVARIANNKRLREEAAAAQEAEEKRRVAAAAAKKETQAANVVIRLTKAQQKKIDEAKITGMKKAAIEQRRKQRVIVQQWYAYNKVEAAWLSRKTNAERLLSNKLQGLTLSYCPSRSKKNAEEGEEEEEEEEEPVYEVSDEDTIIVARSHKHVRFSDSTSPGKHIRSSGSDSGSTSDNPTPRKKRGVTMSPVPKTRTPARPSKLISPKHIAIGDAQVTAETHASPRINTTLAELDVTLVNRNLPRPSIGDTCEQVVARLELEDQFSTVPTLKSVLEDHGLPVSVKKHHLIKRLQGYEGEEMKRIA
jgi:hypothetical protein